MPEINIYKRNFENFNEREFEEIVINGLDWTQICDFDMNDPNHSLDKFAENIDFYLDEMAPYKKVTKKEFKLMLKP